jgi:hypothetical protein
MAFAVVVQGNPQKLLIRDAGKTGQGIVKKITKYIESIPNLRVESGASREIPAAKVLVQFCNFIPSRNLSNYRKMWYRHWGEIAEICFGRGNYGSLGLVKSVTDRSLQFQIDFDFESREILRFQLSRLLKDAIHSESQISAEFTRVDRVNQFPGLRHLS